MFIQHVTAATFIQREIARTPAAGASAERNTRHRIATLVVMDIMAIPTADPVIVSCRELTVTIAKRQTVTVPAKQTTPVTTVISAQRDTTTSPNVCVSEAL